MGSCWLGVKASLTSHPCICFYQWFTVLYCLLSCQFWLSSCIPQKHTAANLLLRKLLQASLSWGRNTGLIRVGFTGSMGLTAMENEAQRKETIISHRLPGPEAVSFLPRNWRKQEAGSRACFISPKPYCADYLQKRPGLQGIMVSDTPRRSLTPVATLIAPSDLHSL